MGTVVSNAIAELKLNLSMKEISVWPGHSDISTNMNIYSHIDIAMKKNTAQKINDLFLRVSSN